MKIVNIKIAAKVFWRMLFGYRSVDQIVDRIVDRIPKNAEVVGIAYDELNEKFFIRYMI